MAIAVAVILVLVSSVYFISSHNTKQNANAAPTSIVNGNFEYAPAKNLLSHVYINSYAYVSIDAMEYWNSYACNNGLGYQTDDTWRGWTKLPSSFTAAGFGWSSTQPRLTTVTPHINANSTEIQLDINGNCYGEITTYSKGTAIYQDVATTPGAIYTWELDHCSINNTYVDKMKVLIGPPLNPTPQNVLSRIKSNGHDGGITAINDGVISTPATNTDNRNHAAQWARYQGRYLVPNGQTVTRFSFQSLDQSSSIGNLVDNISFQISYPLYYNLTGGDASEDFSPEVNNYAGYIAANQSVALTTMKPSRDGYTFMGWSATQLPDAQNQFSYDTNENKLITAVTMASPSKTVYAVWAKNPTITYKDANTGTTVKTETLTPGEASNYPIIDIPAGCHIEWDKTISAAWEDATISYSIVPNSYTINFNGNGAESGNVPSIMAKYEDTITIPNNGFERHGYYFTGWNTKADGSGESFDASQSVSKLSETHSGTVILYAQWELMKEELWIEAEADIDGYGSAIVSWPTYDYYNKNFKVYQQPGEANPDDLSTWQSIGIDYRDVKEVKCLQVYPIDGAKNQLKEWMETNGYGKGIIKITSCDIDALNAAPDAILKDGNGNYIYDVIFFGTWDNNNTKGLNLQSASAVGKFMDSGRGIILGHDTSARVGTMIPGFFEKLELDYIETNPDGSYVRYSGNSRVPYGVPKQDEYSKVVITKKGLLTNYPWNIGDIGTVLTVPGTHTSQQTTAPTWLRFTDEQYDEDDMANPHNFFLAQKGNCAMVQTGHAMGQATDDEQKILANLIFYMNQLVFNTSTLRDASAQDTTAPIFEEHAFDPATATLSLIPKDLGNTYRYKATSYTKDDTTENGKIVDSSNIAEANVTTGTRQIQYLIDDNPNTTLTKDATNNTIIDANDNASLVIDYSPHRGRYLHAIAIDGAGNVSETKTVYLPKLFTVTIKDGLTGDVIATQQVEEGSSVDESCYQLPEPQDWVFIGYDAPLDNIVSDMEITAIYEHVPIEMPETGTHELAIMTIIGFVMFATGISALTLRRKKKSNS